MGELYEIGNTATPILQPTGITYNSVTGRIILSFPDDLDDTADYPDLDDFTFMSNGVLQDLLQVETIELDTLTVQARTGIIGSKSLSYVKGTNPIIDSNGLLQTTSFSGFPVTG